MEKDAKSVGIKTGLFSRKTAPLLTRKRTLKHYFGLEVSHLTGVLRLKKAQILLPWLHALDHSKQREAVCP